MPISVQIAENITVVSALVNDKNSLEIQLSQGNNVDLFEAMSTGASMDSNTQKIMLFPVDNKFYGKEATHQEMVMKFRQLTAKLGESIKNQVKEVKWSMFEGTGITSAADIATKITQESVISKISMNIYTQYAAMVAASDTTIKSRMKLVRQSAAKHFATMPETLFFKKDGGEWTVPFVESMSIPKEQSKLAYSKSEISKGLDNPAPVTADVAPSDSDLPFAL